MVRGSELIKLRELTERLPSFPALLAAGRRFVRHEMDCGTSLATNLAPELGNKCGCYLWFNSTGKFPVHNHPCREWIIIVEGSMILQITGKDPERLLPGTSVVIEQGVEHGAEFIEDCWYLAVTIPRDPSWPKNGG